MSEYDVRGVAARPFHLWHMGSYKVPSYSPCFLTSSWKRLSEGFSWATTSTWITLSFISCFQQIPGKLWKPWTGAQRRSLDGWRLPSWNSIPMKQWEYILFCTLPKGEVHSLGVLRDLGLLLDKEMAKWTSHYLQLMSQLGPLLAGKILLLWFILW